MYICNKRPMYISQITVFTYSTTIVLKVFYNEIKHRKRITYYTEQFFPTENERKNYFMLLPQAMTIFDQQTAKNIN